MIMNIASTIIHVQVFFLCVCVCIFSFLMSEDTPRRGMTESYSNSVFTFGGTAELCPQWLHRFILQRVRIPVFPYCCQHLLFSI